MSRKAWGILLLFMGPLLILGEKITYGEAITLRIHHIIDWLLQNRPYHLLFWLLPAIGLGLLLIDMMEQSGRPRRGNKDK